MSNLRAKELFVMEERVVAGSLSVQGRNTGALGRHANLLGRHDVGEASASESNGLQPSLSRCKSLRVQSFF